MAKSSIEWTGKTWNPTTGCDHASPGCGHCYAETFSHRLKAMRQPKYVNDFELTLHPDTLNIPFTWKKPSDIFVNSMSDLFHVDVPLDFILKVFETMRQAHWHRFQILTKRSGRLLGFSEKIDWPPNVWMGVSVESADYASRIDHLRATGAKTKFLSLEPLLGPLDDLHLNGIDWVIVGGESGPGSRPMKEVWVQSILRQCEQRKVLFFLKQWGGVNKKTAGRELNGRTYDAKPQLVQISG